MSSSDRLSLAVVVLALVPGLVFVPGMAGATPSFPEVIKSELELAEAPECTLCHQGTPAKGSVTTPFGAAMMSRKLVAYDEDSLRTALAALEGEKTDSDGDGVPDIDALRGGVGAVSQDAGPRYGCNNVSGAPPSAGAWLAFGLALVGLRRVLARRGRP